METCHGSQSLNWRKHRQRPVKSARPRTPACDSSYAPTAALLSEAKDQQSVEEFFRKQVRETSPGRGEGARSRQFPPRPRSACQVSRTSNSPVALELHTQFGTFITRTHHERKRYLRPQSKNEYVGLSYKLRLESSQRKTTFAERRVPEFHNRRVRETLACPGVLLQTQEGPDKYRIAAQLSKAQYLSLGEVLTISPAKLKLRPSKK